MSEYTVECKRNVNIRGIKIQKHYKKPRRQYVEQAKQEILNKKIKFVVISADRFILKNYTAYVAYMELGYDYIPVIICKERIEPILCTHCGCRCYLYTELDNMSDEDRFKFSGKQYIHSREYDMDLCRICYEILKANRPSMSYIKEIKMRAKQRNKHKQLEG